MWNQRDECMQAYWKLEFDCPYPIAFYDYNLKQKICITFFIAGHAAGAR